MGLRGKVLVLGGHRRGFCEKDLEAAPCLARAPLLTRAEQVSDVVLRLCQSRFRKKKKHNTAPHSSWESERSEEQPCRRQSQ